MNTNKPEELTIVVIGTGDAPGKAHLIDLALLKNPSIALEEIKEIPANKINMVSLPQFIGIPICIGVKE